MDKKTKEQILWDNEEYAIVKLLWENINDEPESYDKLSYNIKENPSFCAKYINYFTSPNYIYQYYIYQFFIKRDYHYLNQIKKLTQNLSETTNSSYQLDLIKKKKSTISLYNIISNVVNLKFNELDYKIIIDIYFELKRKNASLKDKDKLLMTQKKTQERIKKELLNELKQLQEVKEAKEKVDFLEKDYQMKKKYSGFNIEKYKLQKKSNITLITNMNYIMLNILSSLPTTAICLTNSSFIPASIMIVPVLSYPIIKLINKKRLDKINNADYLKLLQKHSKSIEIKKDKINQRIKKICGDLSLEEKNKSLIKQLNEIETDSSKLSNEKVEMQKEIDTNQEIQRDCLAITDYMKNAIKMEKNSSHSTFEMIIAEIKILSFLFKIRQISLQDIKDFFYYTEKREVGHGQISLQNIKDFFYRKEMSVNSSQNNLIDSYNFKEENSYLHNYELKKSLMNLISKLDNRSKYKIALETYLYQNKINQDIKKFEEEIIENYYQKSPKNKTKKLGGI